MTDKKKLKVQFKYNLYEWFVEVSGGIGLSIRPGSADWVLDKYTFNECIEIERQVGELLNAKDPRETVPQWETIQTEIACSISKRLGGKDK